MTSAKKDLPLHDGVRKQLMNQHPHAHFYTAMSSVFEIQEPELYQPDDQGFPSDFLLFQRYEDSSIS
jgi:hypothetical protein